MRIKSLVALIVSIFTAIFLTCMTPSAYAGDNHSVVYGSSSQTNFNAGASIGLSGSPRFYGGNYEPSRYESSYSAGYIQGNGHGPTFGWQTSSSYHSPGNDNTNYPYPVTNSANKPPRQITWEGIGRALFGH